MTGDAEAAFAAAIKAYREALGQYDPDLRVGSEEQTLRAILAACTAYAEALKGSGGV